MSVQRCRRETSSSEFNDWIVYLAKRRDRQFNEVSPDQFYLAQIAYETACAPLTSTARKSLKISDFILTFKKDTDKQPLTKEEKAAKISKSKSHWLWMFGSGKKKK